MFPEEEHIQHIKQYFAYEHLPSRLQSVSKQFHQLSEFIGIGCNMPEALAKIFQLLEHYEVQPPHLEIDTAKKKLRESAKDLFDSNYVGSLRLILEAKDCAVRAAL